MTDPVRHVSEEKLHIAVLAYLSMALREDTLVVHIPNGGVRGKIAGARLKRMGAKAGMPDLMILCDGRAFFIELKNDRGRINTAQHERLAELQNLECPAAVCRSVTEVACVVTKWGLGKVQPRVAA